MSYYDFPHTRNYDSDLGFLIKRYIQLIKETDELTDVYNQVLQQINEIVTEMFKQGLIKLDCKYTPETEDISFVFSVNEEVDILDWLQNISKKEVVNDE